jgi:hypothetical protein
MLAALVFHVWLAAHPAGASSGIAAENSDAMPEVLAGAAVAEMPGPGESPFGSYGSGSKARQRRQQRRQPVCMRSLGLYLLPRVALLAYFGAWLIALPASGAFNLHFHHYALGWALACFAAFNHPVSGLALAVGTAIFVQVRADAGCRLAPSKRAAAASAARPTRTHRALALPAGWLLGLLAWPLPAGRRRLWLRSLLPTLQPRRQLPASQQPPQRPDDLLLLGFLCL